MTLSGCGVMYEFETPANSKRIVTQCICWNNENIFSLKTCIKKNRQIIQSVSYSQVFLTMFDIVIG